MTRGKATNLPASVRQRLLNIAKERGEEFQYVLTRYGLERLLYRLSESPYASQFILKGAALFQLWTDQPHRPTRDLDLLAHGSPVPEAFRQLFAEVCQMNVEQDGLFFDDSSIIAEQIKEEDEYQGIRLRLVARLLNAKIPLQVDVGFGDAITPHVIDIQYPTLLEFPPPNLRAYPRETVIAEKFQALVMLGMANSRMKDYYDLWTLARQFSFEGIHVSQAIEATFSRRATDVPAAVPLGLSDEFTGDAQKQLQWRAFLRKSRLLDDAITLPQIAELLTEFLLPPAHAVVIRNNFAAAWAPGGPWRT